MRSRYLCSANFCAFRGATEPSHTMRPLFAVDPYMRRCGSVCLETDRPSLEPARSGVGPLRPPPSTKQLSLAESRFLSHRRICIAVALYPRRPRESVIISTRLRSDQTGKGGSTIPIRSPISFCLSFSRHSVLARLRATQVTQEYHLNNLHLSSRRSIASMVGGVSNSPTPDSSHEDIPPLAFDTEQELIDVLNRLRHELLHRIEAQCASSRGANKLRAKGKGTDAQQDTSSAEVEAIVMDVSD